jgi:hypothetical protein
MNETLPPMSERETFDVTVIHGSSGPADVLDCVPTGQSLSRARLRHLRESVWILVSDGSGPVHGEIQSS